MNELIATPVVKNKFWVVEAQGNKIATIQARDDGGYVYVHDEEREYFDTVKVLKKKYNIKFGSQKKTQTTTTKEVYGYPIKGRAFNEVYDVTRKLPVYTKTAKSKSLFCAGYYKIKLNGVWTDHFCPKNITLMRYEYLGPFRNELEMNKFYRKAKNANS